MKNARDWWGLLWPILPIAAGLAALIGLREILPSAGMRVLLLLLLLLAAVWLLLWTFRSPGRSVGYLIQLMEEEPAKKAKGLEKLLSAELSESGRERLMNTDFSKVRGIRRCRNGTGGSALMQLWIGDEVAFLRLEHREKGKPYWSVVSFWKEGTGGPPVPGAKPAASPYRHSRNIHMAVGTLSGVAAFFVFLTAFTSGDRIDRMMEDITAASITALRGNTDMLLRDHLPAELEPFQEAIREITEEVQGYKMEFEESLTAIRYGDVLNARTLSQDRDFGLENILMTLRQGEELAKTYFTQIADICNRAHMQAILDRHGVEDSVQNRYFDGKLYYFEAGDTSRFLRVYEYTTALGEILQDHLDMWYVDEKNQLIFEDETVMDRYNAVYFEMQRLLQETSGSAVV